jgi:hypothetical protein
MGRQSKPGLDAGYDHCLRVLFRPDPASDLPAGGNKDMIIFIFR